MHELCDQCGFDSELYNNADTVSSQRIIASVLQAVVEGLSVEDVNRRPADSTWSIAEYVDHVREVAFGNRFVIESAFAQPGIDLGDSPAVGEVGERRRIDITTALTAVEAEYDALYATLTSLDESQWATPVTLDGEQKTVGWFARHVLHDGLHHMADIGRIRHGFGLGAPTQNGEVAQLNVSAGGVPKLPVSSFEVSAAGISGDAQSDRRHHGRPAQAVCLWGADVIEELVAAGHPIAAGNAGENITVTGINWATLRPGARIDVGNVPMLISAHAVPCAKNAQWFADRDFERILHATNPGSSRLYAIPLAAGSIAAGQPVTVEPA